MKPNRIGSRRAVVLAGLCCAALLAAGRQTALTARVPTPAADIAAITIRTPLAADRAIPIHITAGSSFSIVLASNVTTGYSWRLAAPPPANLLKSAGSHYTAPVNGRVGQGGTETWPFEALRAGRATLTLEYARPWEKGVPPVKRQSFAVTID